MHKRPFLILANPENRRVTLFQEALKARGQPVADVVSWCDFIDDPRALARFSNEPRLFRIDAAGDNDEVERRFLRSGYEDALKFGCSTLSPTELAELPSSRGRILSPRQAHLGFERALTALEEVLESKLKWVQLNPIADIRECFDKRVTSKRFDDLGIPVPGRVRLSNPPIRSLTELRELEWKSVFVKLSCGSSASCLGVLERRRFFTTIEQAPDGWFNNLRMQDVRDPARIEELVDFLFREGAHVEHTVPKAKLDGAFFDCRVLCLEREPAFIVVRQNNHQVTNLHLGGWRGDLSHLRQHVPPDAWEAAMDSCRRVAGCYGALHVGIDLLFEPDFTAHRVIEVNAFGDLLPNLVVNGLSVYETEVDAAVAR